MTKRAKEVKRRKIRTVAVIISIAVAILLFANARQNYLVDKPIGGEIMILFIPLITYFVCKNITLSIDTFGKPKDDFEDYKAQAITQPRNLHARKPKMHININRNMHAEDYRTRS